MPSSVILVEIELSVRLAMTVVMHVILKYLKRAFKDFKVFTWLGLHHLLLLRVGGWVACLKLEIKLSQPQFKLKLSWIEAELGNIGEYTSESNNEIIIMFCLFEASEISLRNASVPKMLLCSHWKLARVGTNLF